MGCADRSCFDLEHHAAATKVELCAKELLPEPVSYSTCGGCGRVGVLVCRGVVSDLNMPSVLWRW